MFFGENPVPNLSPDEVAILDQFMAAPKFGGILVTGDHANLGQGISGQISRAGEMRQYPAPDSIPNSWNTTLEEGPDSNSSYDFNEQSDDKPQNIRCKLFSVGTPTSRQRYRPHPVFCGPNGIIDVLPDHQHEGEAIAPVPTPDSPQWPTKLGYQEAPEVIAWGSIKDPAADKYGQEIGVVSAYNGHNVDVGRILADSTWHHWFDINLTGVEALPSPYAGFDETPAGQEALKKIDAYFLNCAIWLAPPDRQAEMSYAAWWSILWSDAVVQLSPDTPILRLGEEAINALGQRSTRCSVADWILDIPIFKEKIPRWEWPQIFESFQLIDIPLEKFVAGGVVRQLMQEIGHMSPDARFPQEAPSDELLQSIISKGVDEGLSALTTHLQGETALVSKLMDNNFRLN
jgi:hypothetical protein